MPLPTRAILLARISDARGDDTAGVDDQVRQLRTKAAALGWGVGRVIVENDTSAFKRRKIELPDGRKVMRVVRPGFREALDDLSAGRADGLLALDLDRACRDPRDLEDLIDVVEARSPRVPVESVTGSLRLGSDADVTMARVMVAMGNKSSRDTARRVADARLRQATAGRWGGGRRPYGFGPDGVTLVEAEAAEIRKAAEGLINGVSLRALTADLRARRVPTVTGVPWAAATLRDILTRPRNAGLPVYRGEILEPENGRPALPSILTRDELDDVCRVLADPARRTTPGNTPRWLGSLLYRCGHPDCSDAPKPSLRVGTSGKRPRPAYRCGNASHLVRVAPPLDEWVGAVLVERLARPDAADLLAPQDERGDVAALGAEASSLRLRITEARQLWEDGTLSAAEYRASKTRLLGKLEAVQERQHAASGGSRLAGLAGNPDAEKVWAEMDIGRRRAVLEALAVVTVLPSPPMGRRAFDPATVRIDWRQPGS